MENVWKEELRKYLYGEKDANKANQIWLKNRPEFLYRYRTGNLVEGIFLDIEVMSKNKVWASSAGKFNDPYDSAIVVKSNGISAIEKDLKNLSESLAAHTYVSCFCEKSNSMPMWSYYAENHSGFCVKYATSKLEEVVLPVFYDNSVKTLADIKDYTNALLEMTNIKSEEWKHEQEWRMISIEDRDSPIKKGKLLNTTKPTAVYMGCNTEGKLEKELLKYCENYKVSLYRYDLDAQSYSLTPKEVLIF